MDAAIAAEADQGEVGRVEAALRRHGGERAHHRGIGDQMDAIGETRLLLPDALGQRVRFLEGEGPVLDPVSDAAGAVRDLRRLPFSHLIEARDRLVVLQPVTFRDKRDFNAHRLLRAIDNNTLLSKLPESEQAHPEDCMYPVANLAAALI